MIDFANKAVAFSQYVTYWTGPTDQTTHTVFEITGFFVIPIAINVLNVRKYGEVEFWLTALKVQVILVIIIVTIIIAANGAPARLLGTDDQFNVVVCTEILQAAGNCTDPPGFGRLSLRLIY